MPIMQKHLLAGAIAAQLLLPYAASGADDHRADVLEEVIVTAQKREQSMQRAPIAISVLGRSQLETQRIASLDALAGTIPSVRIEPVPQVPSTLVVAIRGNGPSDLGPITREVSVGVYLDGIYLARPQGLTMEVPDLERIEVLRGPQGTLFGRNTTGGAVSLISRKPSGRFDIEQTLGAGNYGALTSITRVNLPAIGQLRAKLDYMHSERDGWVENTLPGAEDFNASEKDGGQLSLNWQPNDDFSLDYRYDKSRVAVTHTYFQFWVDNGGDAGPERKRADEVRAPIPLERSPTEQQGHALIAAWDVSEHLTLKSLTGYRRLEERAYSSYGATVYFNGLIQDVDSSGKQFSQELQFIGAQERLDWVGGLYYFRGRAEEEGRTLFALDMDGVLSGGVRNTLINPPTAIIPGTSDAVPTRIVKAETISQAAYGQATWTPPVLNDRLHLTAGLRFTEDKKNGSRDEVGFTPYDLKTDHWDSLFTIDYNWTDDVSTYLKRSTGYRSGSVNPRSASFAPYGREKVTSWEVGLKSEFNERLRINAAMFRTEYEGMQLDFNDPVNVVVSETFNADKTITVEGAELDITLAPSRGLLIGLSYTYLDSELPLQPNPIASGSFKRFYIIQTPRHAGALSVDYTFAPWRFGTLAAHFDYIAAGQHRYIEDTARADGYDLINARLTLKDIALGHSGGSLQISAWGKNLTDEEYAIYAFHIGDPELAVAQAFGDPRTYGVDFTYRYH